MSSNMYATQRSLYLSLAAQLVRERLFAMYRKGMTVKEMAQELALDIPSQESNFIKTVLETAIAQKKLEDLGGVK